jgi:hypothetical protein
MALHYTGDGEFIIGEDGVVVPPRDLTDDEEKTHKKAIEANEKATGRELYEPVKATAKKPATTAKET